MKCFGPHSSWIDVSRGGNQCQLELRMRTWSLALLACNCQYHTCPPLPRPSGSCVGLPSSHHGQSQYQQEHKMYQSFLLYLAQAFATNCISKIHCIRWVQLLYCSWTKQYKISWQCWDLNVGPPGEKHERYLCAMQLPKCFKIHICNLFKKLVPKLCHTSSNMLTGAA